MRLLHFAETGAVVGGVERYLQALLGGSTPGIEHAVVTHSEGPCDYAGPWPAGSWPWLAPRIGASAGPAVEGIPLFHAPPAPATLATIGRAPFAVFCHDHRWFCPSGTRYYLRPQRPCDIHAGTVSCGIRYHALRCGSVRPGATVQGFLRAAVGREALEQAAAVLCASSYMASQAVRHGARGASTHVVPLPVPLGDAAASGAVAAEPVSESGWTAGAAGRLERLIVCASRLTPEKGVEQLLDAFAFVTAPARLVIAGDGIQESAVAEWVALHPARERITLAGRLAPAAIAAAMHDASVVVMPSVWPEPFGLVGIEALALGKPVVSSGSGGSRDWSREELGVITADPFDARGFAAALDRALTEPDWAARARQAGAAWARERHGMASHVAALIAALAELDPPAEAA